MCLETADRPELAAAESPSPAAVARARRQVRLLDHIFKQTVVLITDRYAHEEGDFAAGSAAVALFSSVSSFGSHKVRLIDATGEPYKDRNMARDGFEEEGLRRLNAGAGTWDEMIDQDGQPFLRAITPVPVVRQKCVLCHPHYADAKPGTPVGAICYLVPIDWVAAVRMRGGPGGRWLSGLEYSSRTGESEPVVTDHESPGGMTKIRMFRDCRDGEVSWNCRPVQQAELPFLPYDVPVSSIR